MGFPRVIYRNKPKTHSWARWMNAQMLRKNNNNMVSFIGKTGSGKTWSAISCAEIMSKMSGVPFNVDHIVFSLRELMELINNGGLKRGSVIIFDEPQASISSKDFQSAANKVFNLLISTFRHRNFSLFFCCPFESLLDKSTRRLFHARFEMLSINPNKKTCRVKPRALEYSDFKTDAYVKQLIVSFKNKEGLQKHEKMFFWDVPQPSDDIIEKYEQKKLKFTTNLNQNIMAKLQEFDNSGKSMTANFKEIDIRKRLTEPQEEALKILANMDKDIPNKYTVAAKQLGICQSTFSQHIGAARRKGWHIKEFEEEISGNG